MRLAFIKQKCNNFVIMMNNVIIIMNSLTTQKNLLYDFLMIYMRLDVFRSKIEI